MFVVAPTHAVPDITRPIVNFRPSIWGDLFLQYDSQSSVLYLYMQFTYICFYGCCLGMFAVQFSSILKRKVI
jgi:hypothetical protein